jgi:hypothetical protein
MNINNRKNGNRAREISNYGAKKSAGLLRMEMLRERSVGLELPNLFMM